MKYIVVLLILASAPLYAQTGSWTQLHGPRGGEIEQAEAGADNTIYIRTATGLVFKSRFPFTNWQIVEIPTGLGNNYSLVTDKGQSLFLCVHLSSIDKESSYQGIYRSADGGGNWTQVLSKRSINKLYRSPDGNLYALRTTPFTFSTVFRSVNDGVKWDSILSFPFEAVDMVSDKNSRLFFTIRSSDKTVLEYDLGAGLFKSLVPANKLNPNLSFPFIALTKGLPFIRYGDEGYLFTANNTFERRCAFQPFNTGIPDPLLSSADGTLYSTTSNSYTTEDFKLVYSVDQGISWNSFATVQQGVIASEVRMALDSSGNFYLGSKTGLFMTSDKGTSWVPIGLFELNATLMQEGPENTLFLHDSDYTPPYTHYRELSSTNGGLDWSTPSQLPDGKYGRLYQAADGGFLYFNAVGYYTHVWYAPQSDPFNFKWLTSIGGLPLYEASTKDKFYIFNSSSVDALVSTSDNGLSWTSQSVPYATLPLGYLAADEDGSLFIGFSPELYRSHDAGATWEQIKTELVNSTVTSIVFHDTNSIIIGTSGEGIWRSNDAGSTWKRWDHNVRDSINSMVIFGKRCYAATNRGLISCDMGSELWQKELFVDEQFPILSLLNYRNEKIFASVGGVGIWTNDPPSNTKVESNTQNYQLRVIYDAALRPTDIEVTLDKPGYLALLLYDVLGNKVATLTEGFSEKTTMRIPLSYSLYSQGFYTLMLRTSGQVTTEKLVIR